jgi:protein-L-isoaspartate(D-aspartate) O-methyltransferase
MRPVFLTVILALASQPVCAADRFDEERQRMVREDLAARDITNPDVLRVMRETPRHLFVPEAIRPQAYMDRPLSIGQGQTISQPYIVALMTQLLEPARQHKVLEIGTGSGYQAAVLAKLVKHVYTIEIVPELASRATGTLNKLDYANVTVRLGDGYKGWPEQAPFDRVILTAAPPEIPKALIDQVASGGRLVAPEGRSAFSQELVVIDKAKDGTIKRRSAGGVMFVPMVPGKSDE